MVGDPNWLYSTIAQASAAIVAIVGGFITATVLMLTSEKRSLRHQLTEKETRLEVSIQEAKRLTKLYNTMRVYNFFSLIAYDLKKEDRLPPLEELMKRYPDLKLDYETLKQEYENLSKKRIEAREFIQEHSDKIDLTKSISFIEWAKENKLDISSYDPELLENEYDRFRTHEKEIREAEKSKAMPFEHLGTLVPAFKPLSWIQTELQLKQQRELSESEKENRRIEEVERRLNSIRQETRLLAGEVTNLDSRLKAFSYPPNLKYGIGVLAYLAAVSIGLPVMIIANETYSPFTKQLTIGLFFSGLTAIFIFIAFHINRLRRR